ncbi:tetratricopeptide repeat protein [Maribacter sp. 2304DJ31-5]|uniref:tetratricopeptide repeat protein n=1 Tax=Maribacter sp. 2304DJ31-5 TaxID=3386273 RepID=UPI0039BC481A
MKLNRFHLLSLVLLGFFFATAQNPMKKGFLFLESGRFSDAELFFKSYLDTDPSNKTAQICYGRAVGLNGRPQKANVLFAELLQTHPNDLEIRINYNESFLWNGEYEIAKPLYAKLVADHPGNFGAALGYANTLSNLKAYKEALQWIEKALEIRPGNQNARLSRKYIRLGYANQFVNKQDYTKGKALLDAIFIDFPNDKDVLLNLANLYLISKAVDSAKITYRRYAVSSKDSITALQGMALAEHIGKKDKRALAIAIMARNKAAKSNDPQLVERTYDRYVQALIWNRKFKTAKQQIDSLLRVFPYKNWVLALKATLGSYTSDTKMSLKNYDAILARDSTSFDGNLGRANALFATGRINEAYTAVFKTLESYGNQKDAIGLIEKLNARHTPTIEEHASCTVDNGNNLAFYTRTHIEVPFTTKFSTTFSYVYRTTENTVSRNKANSHVFLIGAAYKLLPKTLLKGILGLNNSRFMEDAYTQAILETKLLWQPLKLQNMELGYQREVQNFNAALIEREIVMNHYGLNYHLGTNFNLGWYTQLRHTQQSDANTRNLLFTSLYYTLLRKPAFKMGFNYQYIAFKDQVPHIYFSPDHYEAVEVFADIRGRVSEKTRYRASVATGFQKVEENPNTAIFRAEAGIQHQFSKRLSGNLYGKYSNIASSTATGFEFTELGFKLKWRLTQKPLFYKNLVE